MNFVCMLSIAGCKHWTSKNYMFKAMDCPCGLWRRATWIWLMFCFCRLLVFDMHVFLFIWQIWIFFFVYKDVIENTKRKLATVHGKGMLMEWTPATPTGGQYKWMAWSHWQGWDFLNNNTSHGLLDIAAVIAATKEKTTTDRALCYQLCHMLKKKWQLFLYPTQREQKHAKKLPHNEKSFPKLLQVTYAY